MRTKYHWVRGLINACFKHLQPRYTYDRNRRHTYYRTTLEITIYITKYAVPYPSPVQTRFIYSRRCL